MSNILIAKNNSGSEQKFLGTVLQNGEQQQISDFYSPDEIDKAEDLNALILSGDIVINNGTTDLSPSDAVEATTIPLVSQADAEAGTSSQVYTWSPERVKQAANAVLGTPDPLPIVTLSSTDTTSTIAQSSALVLGWDVEREKDAGFTHSTATNNSRLLVDETGTYQPHANITVFSTGQRAQFVSKILIDGVVQAQPYHGGYIRNSGSSSDYWTCEIDPEPIKLNAGQYIEFQIQLDSQITTPITGTLQGDKSSCSLVKLQGPKGAKGDTGAGSNIIVKKGSVTIGTTTSTLQILGESPVVDEGGNQTSIEIGNWAHTSGIYQIPDAQISRTTIIGGGAVDIDNYNPGNFNLHFIDPGTNDRDFTGIQAPGSGINRVIMIINTGTNTLKFKDEDSASTAANRFALADNADFDLGPNGSVQFIYDHSKSRYITFTYY